MREIKFRGLGVDGKWWYGESSPTKEFRHVNLATFFANAHAGAIRPETIGEWTGLKDKNGKEIYEGDVLSGYVPSSEGEVDFEYAKVVFKNGCFKANIGNYYFPCLYETASLEVIGNIYDDGHLLKEK